PQRIECMLNRFPLRIQYALFQRDVDFSFHCLLPCSDALVCLSTYLLIQKIPAIVPNPATMTAKSGQRQGDSPIRYVNSPTTDMTAKMEATNPYSMNNRRNPFTCPLPLLALPSPKDLVWSEKGMVGLASTARPSHPPALGAPRRALTPASTALPCAFFEQRGRPHRPIIRTPSSTPPDTPPQSFPNPSETDPYPSTPSSSGPKNGRCQAKSHRPGSACRG